MRRKEGMIVRRGRGVGVGVHREKGVMTIEVEVGEMRRVGGTEITTIVKMTTTALVMEDDRRTNMGRPS